MPLSHAQTRATAPVIASRPPHRCLAGCSAPPHSAGIFSQAALLLYCELQLRGYRPPSANWWKRFPKLLKIDTGGARTNILPPPGRRHTNPYKEPQRPARTCQTPDTTRRKGRVRPTHYARATHAPQGMERTARTTLPQRLRLTSGPERSKPTTTEQLHPS